MTAPLLALLCLCLAVVLSVLLACQWQAARTWRLRHAAGLLLQAAQAEGYGAQWLTGWPCYDRPFHENTLGLQADEQLVGTIAMGTPQVDVPDRERPDPRDLLTDLTL